MKFIHISTGVSLNCPRHVLQAYLIYLRGNIEIYMSLNFYTYFKLNLFSHGHVFFFLFQTSDNVRNVDKM